MSEEIKRGDTSELVIEVVPSEETAAPSPGELVITKVTPEEAPAEPEEKAAEPEAGPEEKAAEPETVSEEKAAEPEAGPEGKTAEPETVSEEKAGEPEEEPAVPEEAPAAAPAEEVSAAETADAPQAGEGSKALQDNGTGQAAGAVPPQDLVSRTEKEIEEEPEEKRPRKKMPRWAKILIGALIAVAALAGVYVWFCFYGVKDDIYRQTAINDVDITGMTVEEAREAVQKQFEDEYRDASYEVDISDGRKYSIPVFSALSFDASEYIDDAYVLCHGEWYTRGYEYLKNMYFPDDPVEVTVLPELKDTGDIRKAAQDIADEIATSVEESSWSYDGNQVSIRMGEHGESVDPDKIYNEIVSDLKEDRFSGSVSSELILAEPKALNPEEIANAVYVAPVNAAYALQDGEVIVTPASQGAQMTAEEVAAQIASLQEGGTVTIEKTILEPEIREDALQEELFRDRLTVYEVPDGGSPSQKNNQGLACSAVSGTVVMPGEVFSFNDAVGETTIEKGYVEDYAYNQGHLIKEVGGGICRVASTLYAAILGSNLEIEMRYNHSSPVHYLPLGMDATVSYPLPDLQFRNNQGHPVKVIMWLDGGVVHAEILGTRAPEDPYVTVELNPVSDMIVETYRLYYDQEGGELQEREYISTSVYKELIRDYDD